MDRAATVFLRLARELGISDDVTLARIQQGWASTTAGTSFLQTWPCRLSDGVLLVLADSPARIQRLRFSMREILQPLAALGVRDIRFQLGNVPVKPAAKARKDADTRLDPDDISFLDDLAAMVGDESLRESIRRTARKSLEALQSRKSPRT